MQHVEKVTGASERRACNALQQPRSTQRYRAREESDDQRKLVQRIHELVRKRPRFGYRRITRLLSPEGWRVRSSSTTILPDPYSHNAGTENGGTPPSRKRSALDQLQKEFAVSERRACRVLNQPWSTQRYESSPRDDEVSLTKRMRELARRHPRFGYRRIAGLLRQERWRASDTRIWRLWRREGLKVPQKKRKRRYLGTSNNSCRHRSAQHPNDVWAWDFVFDRTVSGSPLKWLSIVDEYTWECVALKVDRSITSEDVIDTLADLFATRGVPRCIRSDNGPSSWPPPFVTGWRALRSTLCIFNRAVRGKTDTRRAFTLDSAMSFWRWKSLRRCRLPGD